MKKMFKTWLVFVSLFMFTNVVLAKNPELTWTKYLNETDSKYHFISTDTYDSVNYYIGGVKNTDTINIAYVSDITDASNNGVVAKYDKDGNLLWKVIPDGVKLIYKVKGTSDGGVVALGENTTKPDGSDFMHSTLFKYDKDGKLVWKGELETTTVYYNGTQSYSINAEIFLGDNGSYVVVLGKDYVNIVVVSSDGKVNRNFNTASLSDDNNDIRLTSCTKDSDNYIVFIGEKAIKDNDNCKLVLYKFDLNGYLVSDREIGDTTNYVTYSSLAINNDNNYVFANAVRDTNYTSSLKVDIYDKSGKLVGSKSFVKEEGKYDFYTYLDFKLTIDLEGNYIINYAGPGYGYSKKYDTNLNKIWEFDDLNNFYPSGFIVDKYNNYIYVGGVYEVSPQNASSKNPIAIQPMMHAGVNAGFISKYSTDYKVETIKEGVGEVESSASTATAGDTVTIKATPGEGYRIDKIIVTDANGNNIDVVDNKFIMPASDVTIKVIFTNTPIENPKTGTMDVVGALVILALLGAAGYQYIKSKDMVKL